jgi:hypothetical protein
MDCIYSPRLIENESGARMAAVDQSAKSWVSGALRDDRRKSVKPS